MKRLARSFYTRDVLDVAPDLIGQWIVRRFEDQRTERFLITEVEAYRGPEDLASHASKGRTKRTEVMYHQGGKVYMYLIYGMYWMLNIVAGGEGQPHAVLIRGLDGIVGPGRLTRALNLTKEFYGEDLIESKRLWLEERGSREEVITTPRIGIDYSGEYWKNRPWRYVMKNTDIFGA